MSKMPEGLRKVVVSPVEFDQLTGFVRGGVELMPINNDPFRAAWDLSKEAKAAVVQAGSGVVQFIVDGPDHIIIVPDGHYFRRTIDAIYMVAIHDLPVPSTAKALEAYAVWLALRWNGQGTLSEKLLDELDTYLLTQYAPNGGALETEPVFTLADRVIDLAAGYAAIARLQVGDYAAAA
jgi:hypothetical protein